MQQGSIIRVRTDKDDQFTAALAQNVALTENLVAPGDLGAGGHCRSRLHSISILSDQNLAWEIALYSTDSFNTSADMDQVSFLGRWGFQAGDGTQIAGTGPYFYYIDGLDIPYRDADFTSHIKPGGLSQGQIHLMLVNRSATGKNAGATGEIVVQLGFEITEGR